MTRLQSAPTGPTLNRSYNDLLVRWGNVEPRCEDCDENLTGCDVHDTGISWLCSGCFGDNEDRLDLDNEYADDPDYDLDRSYGAE